MQLMEVRIPSKSTFTRPFLTFPPANLDTLSFPEMADREMQIKDAHTDSCNWILAHDSYLKWTQEGRALLGIKGKPGSGKSTLMKKIFQMANKDTPQGEVQLAFFFHRRGNPLQQTLLGMFRTLLHQLLSQVSSVRAEFRTLCDEKKKWRVESGKNWDWRVEELRPVFSSALLAAAKSHKIRIFVDALDEASYGENNARNEDRNQATQEAISFLYEINTKLLKLDAPNKICFSCRHFPIIRVEDGFEICVEDHNKDDIDSYTSAMLRERIQIEAGAKEKNSILASLQADIVSRAEGVFMWVALVVPLVANHHNEGDSSEAIRRTLRAVPPELDDIYHHILTKVVNPQKRTETLHMMYWIFLAERPLSVTELRFAIASDDASLHHDQQSCQESEGFVETDMRMEKWIKSRSGGLAEVKTHSENPYNQKSTVQFIHQSVNDFLGRDKFRCFEPIAAEDLIGQGHHQLARSCINYWKLEETQQKVESYINKEEVKTIPFIEYATKYWFIHAEKAERAEISQQDLVQRLKGPSYDLLEVWVETFRTLDKYGYEARRPELGATLLHIAAGSNLRTALQELLQHGGPVEKEDMRGNRAIHYAARWGHDQVMNMLLDAHAVAGPRNKYDETPLSLAAGAGHKVIVQLLLKLGEDIDNPTGESGNALQAAATAGQASVVRLLLQMGADVNAQGGQYGNALSGGIYYRI